MTSEEIEQVLFELMDKMPERGPTKIFVNHHTWRCIRQEFPQGDELQSSPLGIPMNLYGIGVYIDNSLPDFEFETDLQREERDILIVGPPPSFGPCAKMPDGGVILVDQITTA